MRAILSLAAPLLMALPWTAQCGSSEDCEDPCTCEAKLAVRALPPVPTDIIMVLDVSESMQQPLAQQHRTSRWQALRRGVLETLPAIDEAGHHVALFTFPDVRQPSASCAVAEAPLLPLGESLDAVQARLEDIEPQAGSLTPMHGAMEAVQRYLTTLPADRRRVIVLGTDGLPKCDPKTPYDDAATLRVAEVLRRLQRSTGVPTAVFGIATAASAQEQVLMRLLDQLAEAGGMALKGGMRRFYDVDSPQLLLQALRGVTQSGGDCRFQLDPTPPGKRLLRVDLDDKPLAQSPDDGWDYAEKDLQQLRLHGAACDQVRSGAVQKLRAVYQPAVCAPSTDSSQLI